MSRVQAVIARIIARHADLGLELPDASPEPVAPRVVLFPVRPCVVCAVGTRHDVDGDSVCAGHVCRVIYKGTNDA